MAEPDGLLSTRQILTALISTIATATQDEQGTANPLSNASPNTKSALSTLHTLFPNDLLPALDLLDRGLVTRFVLASGSNSTSEQAEHTQSNPKKDEHLQHKKTIAYYVRTAQKSSSRSRAAQATTSYEVHLTAWSCSCPAFAFAAFSASLPSDGSVDHTANAGDELDGEANESWFRETGWRFGGLTRGSDVPACKHLLACTIAERCEGFAGLVEEKEVGMDEVAGWAAGWGD